MSCQPNTSQQQLLDTTPLHVALPKLVRQTADMTEHKPPSSRYLPLKGRSKGPYQRNAHRGVNGDFLRVCVYKESGVVLKVNTTNWTAEANAKFEEMYGGEGGDEGVEFSRRTALAATDLTFHRLEAELNKLRANLNKMKEVESVKDTTARRSCICPTCNSPIAVGDRVTVMDSKGSTELAASALPAVLQTEIAKSIGSEEKTFHAACADVNKTITKSGRVSRIPVRFGDEKFIPGSGIDGCDQYDGGYNRGSHRDWEGPGSIYDYNLRGFVIQDDELVVPMELSEPEEKEWTDYEDSDEEEDWTEEMV